MAEATCIACNRHMGMILDDDSFKSVVHVCVYTDCPNMGLMAVTREKIQKHLITPKTKPTKFPKPNNGEIVTRA